MLFYYTFLITGNTLLLSRTVFNNWILGFWNWIHCWSKKYQEKSQGLWVLSPDMNGSLCICEILNVRILSMLSGKIDFVRTVDEESETIEAIRINNETFILNM